MMRVEFGWNRVVVVWIAEERAGPFEHASLCSADTAGFSGKTKKLLRRRHACPKRRNGPRRGPSLLSRRCRIARLNARPWMLPASVVEEESVPAETLLSLRCLQPKTLLRLL